MQADPIPWSNTSFSSLATQTTFLRDMLAKWVKKAQIPLPSDSTSSSNDLRVAEQSVAQEPNPPSPSTERMNSMLKLAAGGRRWRLTGQGLADEVLIRTVGPSLPDAEDLIHRAVVQWSIAAERRPQSYEDSSESDSDEMGTSDSDTSFATGSSISSGEEGSMSSRSAASADDDEEPLPQPEPAEPQQPEQAEEDVQQDAPQDAAPDFLSWLSKYRPQLAAYEIRLRRDGWDTVQSLKLLTVEDMAQLNILPGHRRLLVDTVKDL